MADEKNDIAFHQTTKIIKLNVGGMKYTLTKETVEKCPALVNLIKGSLENDEKDEIFINRDGLIFRKILQYLRDEAMHVEDVEGLKELRAEASFFNLDSLEKLVDEKLKKKSSNMVYRLLDQEQLEGLSNLNPENPYSYQKTLRTRDDEEVKIISTITYLKKVYKCPRDLLVHRSPADCGRLCRRIESCNHTGWVYEDSKAYLIAYREGQLNVNVIL
jgi:hypothetical protein